jgi:hypothetical protein
MTDARATMLPDPDSLARTLAAILGGAPDIERAARLLSLCRAQLAAARPALDRAEPMDDPRDHATALRDLARHG